MRIRVRLFSILRERTGESELIIDVPPGATVEQAALVLREQRPTLRELRVPVAYAVNRSYVDAGSVLADGDELALIPPVSGG